MAGKKILIADDSTEILQVLEKKLRESGYEVLALSEGRDAVEKARLYLPDLIILDIVMPGWDGYTVASALRLEKNFEATPIIFMSAKDLEYPGIQKRLSQLDYCDFITKPCLFNELLDKVKQKIG
jgi:DNA-binding response OmpR family regulator